MSNLVTCQLCNKQYKNKIQATHLRKFHDITRGEYELKFGRGSSFAVYEQPEIPLEQQIECKICGEIHKNSIAHAHLKLHGWTTAEYKEVYGERSLTTEYQRNKISVAQSGENHVNYGKSMSDEQKKLISDTKKQGFKDGKYIPPNLGKSPSEETKKKQSDVMKRRYADGELTPHLKGKTQSDEIKKKISDSVKEYARNNKDKLSERGRRAYQTSVQNGTHERRSGWKHTDESRHKISQGLETSAAKKSETSYDKLFEFINNEGYTIKSLDKNSKGYITFICNCGSGIEHTTTRQLFDPSKYVRYDDKWCRFCDSEGRSLGESQIAQWISDKGIQVLINYRSAIYPYELDIYLPDHNIAIEFNGLYWHSELVGKDKHYHNIKRKLCESKGIRLIQVMEDEWYNKPDIVKSIISNALHIIEHRIFARKCEVKPLSVSTAREFVEQYHIGGYHACSHKYGLYYDDELVSVMTFSKGNYSRKGKGWEIDRFCSKYGVQIIGGASKLFKRFIRDINPELVISYADLRYGTGNVYEQLGFDNEGDTVPNYWYFKDNLTRYHRFSLRKGVVTEDDANLTEWENRVNQGWNRIWDCGSRKYVWNK